VNWLLLDAFDLYNERCKVAVLQLGAIKIATRRASVSLPSSPHPPHHGKANVAPAPKSVTLASLISDLEKRLVSLFMPDKHGARPCHGKYISTGSETD
jgi:hypothetical protein